MAMFRALNRNIPYLRQQCGALLGNTSTPVKVICAVMLFGYGLSFSDGCIRAISITPGYIMPPSFWVWTAATFCFLEIHLWEVLVDVVTVGLCGKLIEPLWGQLEMLKFFGVVNLGVAVLTTAFYYVCYAATINAQYVFDTNIHGLAGYIAGVSVAVKQIMPDLVILNTPLGKLSNRNIPLTVFFVSLIFKLVGLVDGTYPTMFCCGLIVSWIYLRFYQSHSNGSRGDMADYFTFASFFPNVIQPPIAIVGNSVYNVFVRVGLCKKVIKKIDIANPTGVSVVSGADHHDMERRRQIALKALSERLSKSHGDKQPLIPKSSRQALVPNLKPAASHQSPMARAQKDGNATEAQAPPATTVDVHSNPMI